MSESTQKKLSRIRPPRVQITYDLEVGNAIVMKELPFVGGILSDLSGMRKNPLPPLKERKFVEIDRDNFNDVMESIGPHLEFTVANKLTKEGGRFKVALDFKEIDDFHPASLIHQVEPLRKMFEARARLLDLFVKLDGNDELENLLQAIIRNSEELKKVNEMTVPAEDTAAAGKEAPGAGEGEKTE
jgi:type VI secretion system protein ImpB